MRIYKMISTTSDVLNSKIWQFKVLQANLFLIYFQIWIRTEKSINRNNFILPKISYPNFLNDGYRVVSVHVALKPNHLSLLKLIYVHVQIQISFCIEYDILLIIKKEASQYSTYKGLKGCSKQGIQIGHFSLHYSESYRPFIRRSHSKLIQIWIFFKFSFESDLKGNFLFPVWFKPEL